MARRKSQHREDRRRESKDLRVVFLVFLVLLSIFILKNYGKLQKEAQTPINSGVASEFQTIDKESEVTQTIKGNGLTLKQINLYFGNNYYGKSKGNVIITLTNEKGDTVGEMSVAAKDVKNLSYVKLTVNERLKRGKTYTLSIKGDGVTVGEGPILYRVSDTGKPSDTLFLNGEATWGSIYASYVFPVKSIVQMVLLVAILIVLAIVGMLYIPSSKKYGNSEMGDNWNVVANLLFLVVPIIGFIIVERFTQNSITNIYPLAIVFNILLYYAIFGLIYVICGNQKVTTVFYLALLYGIGAANYFVLSFRGSPVVPSDIASAGTAKNVAANYTYTLTTAFISNLIIILYVCTIICKNKKFKPIGESRKVLIPLIVLGFVVNAGFIHQESFLEHYSIKVNVWNQKKGYSKNGTLFGFAMNFKYLTAEKPDGYSMKEVKKIAENYMDEEEPEGKIQDEKPNIIVIMDEAFSDLSVIHKFETNKDYMPFIKSLEKNTVKGQLYVSVFGGNTCNTEMEFLTGNTMAFLPNGSIGYTQFIKGELPNLTTTLKKQNYTGNYAFHPYLADGWNRVNVYNWFGFSDFLSQDDVDNPTLYRKYISDESDFDKIIELYEQNKKENGEDPFYLFNVTMQNHGGYTETYANFENDVEITDENSDEQANQYLSLIKKTDEAFEQLVKYFEKVDEPTMIVMFGDHEPSLDDSFYEKLYGKKLADLTQEELQKKYQTPYVIWANYDIDEEEKDMSANYLSSYILKIAGLETTGYNRFLLNLQKKVPIINAVGYIGADGKQYTFDDESEYKSDILKYQILQYNNLIDTKHRYTQFFE